MLTGPSHSATVSIRQNNKTTGNLKPTEFMRTTTRLGLGTASLGSLDGDDADDSAIATIRAAIDAGIDYIDTAPHYSDGERRTGLALADGYRDRVFLSTKTSRDYSGSPHEVSDRIRHSFERSLNALETNFIDLFLIHDPPDADAVFAPGAALDTVLRLKSEGAVGAVGIGVRDLDILQAGIASGQIDAVLTFLEYTLLSQSATRLFAPAAAGGVTVINGSPIGMGMLVDNFEAVQIGNVYIDVEKNRAPLREWAHANDLTLQGLALHYSLAECRIARTLTGAKSVPELEESLGCFRNPLPVELWARLEEDLGVPAPLALRS